MDSLVSVVIPCYKGERFLAVAIESCLAQTHVNLEVIVVDDASPDGCGRIAKELAQRDPRVRLLHHEQNQGVANAFNTGFNAARGEFFTRLAQDDLFAPQAIATMVAALQAAPDAGLVYCDEKYVDDNGNYLSTSKKPDPDDALVAGNKMGLCVMWRRAVWEKVGEFNPHYDSVEDYEYWLRAREHFQFIHCPKVVFSFRVHGGMGSRIFSVKQELLTADLKARNAQTSQLRRRYLAEGFFNAGYNAGMQGDRQLAVRLLFRAIRQRPFWLQPYKAMARFVCMTNRG